MPPRGRRPGRGRGPAQPSATGSAAPATSPATTPTRRPAGPAHQHRSRRCRCPTPARNRPRHKPPDRSPTRHASSLHIDSGPAARVTRLTGAADADRPVPCRTENGADDMTTATSTPITAPLSTRPPAPPGLRLQLDPTMAATGAVDGGRVRVGWFRHMDADTIGVARAAQDRVVLLVVPPQATTAAAEMAMARAADGANSAGPAEILAAAGLGGQGPAPMPRSHPIRNTPTAPSA